MNRRWHNLVDSPLKPGPWLRSATAGLSLLPPAALALVTLLGITASTGTYPFPQTAMASTPPGPCDAGWVAPTPTAVAVTAVPIVVSSTTADYFVLYAKHTIYEEHTVDGISTEVPVSTDVPMSVTRGEDGTTTLSDNLQPLPADQYRVEKYQVANPADVDGDCVDDITELDDLGTYNPINSAKKINIRNGAVAIESHAAFQELAFQGISHETQLDGIEFVKFWIFYPFSDSPEVFYLNTKRHLYHNPFVRDIGYPQKAMEGAMAGQLVWHPNVPGPDGTLGVYRFEWGSYAARTFARTERVYMMLAAGMPFLEDNLYFYPETTPYFSSYWDEREKVDASRIRILLEHQVLADVDYIALNQGEGYGRLRLMEDGDRPSTYDVAIYTSLPNDLPRVAGTITTVPQTPLSHVNLRAIQNNLPNAFIRDILKDETITSLLGKYVYYAVTDKGYTIREATKTEVDAHHNKLRPQNVQTLQSDLTVKTIASLDDVDFDDWTAYGVKAANVAELTTLSLPDGTTPVGYAVPFYFYDEFMKQATIAKEATLGKKSGPDEEKIVLAAGTTLASAVTQMLAHPYFHSDTDVQEEMLDDLREEIRDAASPKFITDALTAMHATYPDGQSLRYRSSTNNEDLPNFNGAGLYSSKTQDPDETTADGIDKSIKAVWASLWNHRAFLERDFHRIDHTTVYMGVLVHPNYSDETVNGVAVSYDPITFQDNAYYVNSQVGEDLVTNPEAYSQPEQLLLNSAGAATVLSRSNLATSTQPLMTEAQMRQLRSNLDTIHNHFKTLYGVQDGDDFAIEIEFKITAANQLAIKQARPWIFAQPLELTPTVTMALSSAQVSEGDSLELTVTRSGGVLSLPLTVDLTWSETGAMLKAAKPASVTIPVNQATKTINVPTENDQKDEHDSVVSVSIADDSKYTVGTPSSASVTVTDNDLTQISVRAHGGTVTEGSAAKFTFNRSGSVLEQPLTVDITVSETGNRLTGPLPSEITFAANSATASVSLATADDEVITSESVVSVQVDAGSSYEIDGAGSARVTVQDDEVPGPTLLFAAEHAVDDQEHYVVALELSLSYGQDVRFVMTGPDTGLFVLYGSSELLLFNPQAYDTPRDANGDGVYEIDLEATNAGNGSTTVRMRLVVTNPELIALAEQQWDQTSQDQRNTLLPDETSSRLQPAFANLDTDVQAMALRLARQGQLPSPGPTVSVTAGGDITEGGDATFTVTADPAPAANLAVTVSVSQSGDFGVSPGSQTVTIPTSGSAQLTVATSDDQVGESDGSVKATVSHGNGYLVSWFAGAATVKVGDDDGPPPEISISGGSSVTEGGDATFTVTADPAPTANLDVTVAVTTVGDYGVTAQSHTVTIPSSGSAALTVATTNDSADESDGSVTATVNAGTGYTVSKTAGSATVGVTDDDLPEISIVSVGDVTEGDNASFTITADPAPASNLDVTIAVSQSGDFGAATGPQTVTIPTSGSATLTVATTNDSADESDGSVTATVNAGTGYTVSKTAGAATVDVADDDDAPAGPEISIVSDGDVTEGSDATFTITADPAPASNLDVTIAVSQSGDFGVSSGPQTVTIPTSGSATLTVATADDSAEEADGSVTATINTGTGYTVSSSTGTATVNIADNDDPTSTLTCDTSDTSVADGIATARAAYHWHVNNNGGNEAMFWRLLNTFGADNMPTKPSGVVTDTVTLSEIQTFSNGKSWSGWQTIIDGLQQCSTSPNVVQDPEVSITAGGTITEGGDAAFTVTADPAPAADLDVTIAVTTVGDYGVTAQSHTVTVPTSGSAALTLSTTNDSVDEADGSVTATVNAGTGYTVSATAGAATVAVSDNDVPEISVTAGSTITEGGDAVFTLSANPTPQAALDVTVVITSSGDFGVAPASHTVTIPTAGTAALTMSTTGDTVVEANGTVTATVTSGAGYTIATSSGVATVTVEDDDDPPATCDKTDSTIADGIAAARAAYDWHIDNNGGDEGLFWRILNTLGADNMPAKPSGVTTDTVTSTEVTTFSDGKGWNGWQTIIDALDACGTPSPAPPTVVPEVSIAASTGITEGGDATFTVTASPAPSAALTVSINVTQSGGFGVPTGQHQLTISTSGTGTLTLSTTNDAVDEPNGSITATVTNGQGYTVDSNAASATVAVSDDDDPAPPPPTTPVISISAGPNIVESGLASFTLTATPAPTSTLTVNVTVGQVGDFGVTTGTDTVAVPTSGTVTYTVATFNDSVDEPNGSVTVTVDSGTGYTVSSTAGSATVAVADDDDPAPATPEISVSGGAGITEGGSATFTVTASPAPTSGLSVSVTIGQTGDYATTGPRTVVVPASGSISFTVTTVNDSADEADGSVTATVNAGQGYTVSATEGTASVAVADDDVPEISISAGAGVTEGGNATFTITASPTPHVALSVSVNVTQSGDFGVATGSQTVTIPTSGSYTLTIATSDDSTDEANGSVTVTVNTGTGYDVSSSNGTATVAISDDDPPKPKPVYTTPTLTISDASGTEGDTITFTVTLSPSRNGYVWVNYYSTPLYGERVSAGSGDFEGVYGMLTFKPGETEKTITVALTDDSKSEGTEAFGLRLYSEAQAQVADREGIGTIIDND